MNAFEVKNLFKTFKVPHEDRSSIRQNIFSLFKGSSYEKFDALSDLSFEIKKGEFFGVIGRNGSGKSTLLKILAGVYTSTSGEIKKEGKIVPFLELGVGFNEELTGRENVFLNASILGLNDKEIALKYNDIVKFAELDRFMDQQLKKYSSGMQVRLAFSIAMQIDADIYLMDEVLAVGDTAFQMKCFDMFLELKKKGKTIVFVSHDLNSVRKFCDRVLYLKDGKGIAIGDTNYVLDKYTYTDSNDSILDVSNVLIDKEKFKGDIGLMKFGILDKFGKETNRILSGDSMELYLEFYSNVEEAYPNLGFVIYDSKGTYVFGSNSEIKSYKLKKIVKGVNKVSLKFPSLSLLSGKYFVTIVMSDYMCTKDYIWLEKCVNFNVVASTRSLGIVELDYYVN